MKVNTIIPNIFMHKANIKNNHNDYSSYRYPVRDEFVPSFNARISYPITTQRDFKKHAIRRGTPCLYCNIPLKYDDSMYEEWKQNKLYSSSIKNIINTLQPYKNSLHPTEKEVFEHIEKIAQKRPEINLSEAIKIIAVESNKKLLKIQMPIFDEIMQASVNLPIENQYKLFELIQKSKFRMLKKPYIEEFSGKEFNYKIKNLAKTIPNDKVATRITKLAELYTIPELRENTPLNEKIIKRILRTIDPQYKVSASTNFKNPKFTNKNIKKLILKAIQKEIKDIRQKDLSKICDNAEKQLNGLPITNKFSNKAFLYDLNEALEGLEGKPIRGKIFEIAGRLPTSTDNIHAFITKHDEASCEKIAYDLLVPSVVTIEHMKPTFHKGKNNIINWAIACKRCNNSRGSKDMDSFYKHYPKENAQKYWNTIIEDTNRGYFNFNDTVGMLKTFKRQSKMKINSKNLKFRPEQ